jgi:type IV pilus assembly protein PilW
MAGFIGCNNNASLTNTTSPAFTPNTLNTPTAFLYNFSKPIEGFESTSTSAWTPTIDAAISSPQGGSDVITIRRAADQGFTVITQASVTDGLTLDSSATTTNLQTVGFLNSSGTNNCTIAVVNNCSSASVFQVSSITGSVLSHSTGSGCTPDNSTISLPATYVGGQVFPINTISYYLSTNPNNNLSIYRKVGSSIAQELVEGIEQMQILYGEDTDQDGTPNYYVTANNVVNMLNVVSIRISLLAVTVDNNLTAQPLTYTYNGSTTTPTDNKIRRVFNTTIAVRN